MARYGDILTTAADVREALRGYCFNVWLNAGEFSQRVYGARTRKGVLEVCINAGAGFGWSPVKSDETLEVR